MIEAVAFDLDGTLVRLPIDYEMLFEEFKKIMRLTEVRPLVDTISKVDEKTRKLVFTAWDKAEFGVFKEISINEKGMKIYRNLADETKALVTLQGKAIVDAILKRFGLVFDTVITREDAFLRINQLKKVLVRLEVNANSLLFVGNTDGDAAAAKKIGCQFHRIP
ncbi:MAG TPA: HAD hydrolase-like protein [Candidatus Bathyarchaeia archaeon]